MTNVHTYECLRIDVSTRKNIIDTRTFILFKLMI